MISQVFWPDTASVAQHMGDLAEKLQDNNHVINVYTSRNAYEDTTIKFLPKENHQGIYIERIRHTAFGKKTVIGRLCDFFSFNLLLFFKLLFIKKNQYNLIFSTTSPPLVSYISVKIAKWKKISFCYWTMDLQPELAIASGMIKENSISTKLLTHLSNYIIKSSDLIFTLDKYMKAYLVKRGAVPGITHILPVWPVMDQIYEGPRTENPFRIEYGFYDKIVVMYSGNHAYVHPLDTLLEAAYKLKEHDRFLFVFIGGGVRKNDVTEFKKMHSLDNIIQLPYQPRKNIHNSLGAADIQVVILGEGQVGYTHPNKVYGAMFIAKPLIYIGPAPSHITDILKGLEGNISVRHGDSDRLAEALKKFEQLSEQDRKATGTRNQQYAAKHFYPEILKKKMVEIIENSVQ